MKNQNGMALLVSLIIVLVAAILGLSSFSSSLLEERMAANHRFSISALQTAEAGVEEIMDHMSDEFPPDSDEFCAGKGRKEDGGPVRVGDGKEIDRGPYTFSSDGGLSRRYVLDLKCEDERLVGYSRGWVYNDAEENIELSARRLKIAVTEPGFFRIEGMLAECGVDLNGQSTIVGNVHSNCGVDIRIQEDDSIELAGFISAHQVVTINNEDVDPVDGDTCNSAVCASSNADYMDVPSAREYINKRIVEKNLGVEPATEEQIADFDFADFIAYAKGEESLYEYSLPDDFKVLEYDSGKNECSVGEVDLAPSDTEELTYYCPGELKISGDFGGVVVMAEGNLTHTGTTSIGNKDGDEVIDTFVVSGGTITLNGTTKSEELFAAYLAQDDFEQNGNAKIYGSIVSGGLITGNGGIDFEARDTDFITVPVPAHFRAWDELEDPGLLSDFDV